MVILSGEPGSYKTWLLLHIALCVAAGKPVFGQFATTQGPVLIIDEENRHALLQDRLKRLGADQQLPITFSIKSGFSLESRFAQLLQCVVIYGIKLVMLDSFVRMHERDENDAKQMSSVFKLLSSLQAAGAAVLMTHHHRKDYGGGARKSQSLRGSSDILAALDSHLSIERKGSGQIEITQTKLRDREEVEAFGLTITNVDDTSTTIEFIGSILKKKQDEAKARIPALLVDRGEMARADLVAELKDVAGGNAVANAIKELLTEQKIIERVGEKNKKFYSAQSLDSSLVS